MYTGKEVVLQYRMYTWEKYMNKKTAIGFFICFSVGFISRMLGISSPCPPVLEGALLVLSMTLGYVGTDLLLTRMSRLGDTPQEERLS